ncbi:hypothetical protein SDC9_21400 [bioreactor metagenome]|uniref:Uncharacterized protein n=1 Tax=bioreactor metagenome TaxID=1076179 RepID=A0A644U9F4_9ZZZZ
MAQRGEVAGRDGLQQIAFSRIPGIEAGPAGPARQRRRRRLHLVRPDRPRFGLRGDRVERGLREARALDPLVQGEGGGGKAGDLGQKLRLPPRQVLGAIEQHRAFGEGRTQPFDQRQPAHRLGRPAQEGAERPERRRFQGLAIERGQEAREAAQPQHQKRGAQPEVARHDPRAFRALRIEPGRGHHVLHQGKDVLVEDEAARAGGEGLGRGGGLGVAGMQQRPCPGGAERFQSDPAHASRPQGLLRAVERLLQEGGAGLVQAEPENVTRHQIHSCLALCRPDPSGVQDVFVIAHEQHQPERAQGQPNRHHIGRRDIGGLVHRVEATSHQADDVKQRVVPEDLLHGVGQSLHQHQHARGQEQRPGDDRPDHAPGRVEARQQAVHQADPKPQEGGQSQSREDRAEAEHRAGLGDDQDAGEQHADDHEVGQCVQDEPGERRVEPDHARIAQQRAREVQGAGDRVGHAVVKREGHHAGGIEQDETVAQSGRAHEQREPRRKHQSAAQGLEDCPEIAPRRAPVTGRHLPQHQSDDRAQSGEVARLHPAWHVRGGDVCGGHRTNCCSGFSGPHYVE